MSPVTVKRNSAGCEFQWLNGTFKRGNKACWERGWWEERAVKKDWRSRPQRKTGGTDDWWSRKADFLLHLIDQQLSSIMTHTAYTRRHEISPYFLLISGRQTAPSSKSNVHEMFCWWPMGTNIQSLHRGQNQKLKLLLQYFQAFL